jgi:hypothetical protein
MHLDVIRKQDQSNRTFHFSFSLKAEIKFDI